MVVLTMLAAAVCALWVVYMYQADAAEHFGPYRADVIDVSDGDTIKMLAHKWPDDPQIVRIRLNGVNTGETKNSGRYRPEFCELIDGFDAWHFTERFLENRQITIDRVRFGAYPRRMVADVYADGESLANALLESGLAMKSNKDGSRKSWRCNSDY